MTGQTTGAGVWVVVPTYNERDNIGGMVSAIRSVLPEAGILVVDDGSPDGTGALADAAAEADERIHVLHRSMKEGLGAAYRAGFAEVLARPDCRAVVQMDCDFSHDPGDVPRLLAPLDDRADLVLGTRYIRGGGTPGWGLMRRVVSRGGTTFARTVLLLPYRDLTGGFKAWRADLLRDVVASAGYASGYGFQVEMTWMAHRRGARIVQVPIIFRDRTVGQSKMGGGIVMEAMLMVLRLRWDAIRRAAMPRRPARGRSGSRDRQRDA
jgi:dolichol-phosphate mannosyltransferase